jgi:UDP-GlcNAc:undecaprenyl-phosphate GlcNAc-1-phosphate transferase
MYVSPFLSGLCASVFLCFCLVWLTRHFGSFRQRENAYYHKSEVSRFGGVAMIIAFILALVWDSHLVFDRYVWSMVCGSALILIFGIIDDIKTFSWKTQIFFQIMIVLLVFIFGVRIIYISNPLGGVMWLTYGNVMIFSLAFLLVWVITIMNAINWIDGIDGLSGGVVSIAAITIFFLSLQPEVMQPPIAIISIAFCGVVVGFLTFNFPRAYIFAGSSGSFFMGYILAIMAIMAGAKIGTTLMVLAVPLVDAVWVIIYRLRKGQSIFVGDYNHLHHRLLSRGWGVRKILFLYYGITIMSAVTAILTRSLDKLVMLFCLCMMIITFFVILDYDKREKSIV